MKIALIALAGLLPALASADDPKPYVVYQGLQVRAAQAAPASKSSGAESSSGASQNSAFGTNTVKVQVSPANSSSSGARSSSGGEARAFRGVGRASRRRGIVGSTPIGTPAPTPAATDAPPAYAVPGAKIISAGQQPVYSDPGNGGTHSVEGGGFIAIDQSKAHDVGRAPGISWAPPDTPPKANRTANTAGSGASSNGPAQPASGGGNSNGPTINVNNGNTNGNQDGGNGNGNGGTGFNPAF